MSILLAPNVRTVPSAAKPLNGNACLSSKEHFKTILISTLSLTIIMIDVLTNIIWNHAPPGSLRFFAFMSNPLMD